MTSAVRSQTAAAEWPTAVATEDAELRAALKGKLD